MTAGSGPRPTVAATLTPARRRVLELVAALRPPVPTADLADAVGGHPNAVRRPLDELLRQGLIRAEAVPSVGRGRPRRGYRLTPAGRRALDGTAHDYADLVAAMASYLVGMGEPAAQANRIGRRWREARTDLPSPPGATPSELVESELADLGFGPEVAPPRPGAPDAAAQIRLRTCPYLNTARAHPTIVCEIHRGYLQNLAEQVGADTATLLPFADDGACLLLLS